MIKKNIWIGNVGIDTITCQGYEMSLADLEKMKHLILCNKIPNDMKASVSTNGSIHIEMDSLRFQRLISNNDHKAYNSFAVRASGLYGINIQNMSVVDVQNQLLQARQRLESIFGVTIWENNVEVQKIELNQTTVQNHPFFAFSRIFSLIASVEPSLKWFDGHGNAVKNVRPVDSIFLKNKSRGIRIYDKSKQMKENGIVLQESLVRTELVFYKKKAIQSAFKTASFYQWNDQLLERVFQEKMAKIKNKIMKYRDEKLLYSPVCLGAKETVPFIINKYYANGWDRIMAALVGYENIYCVPCLVDIQDIQYAVNSLVYAGIFRAGTESLEYNDAVASCVETETTKLAFTNQWDHFFEYFDKIFNINPVEISIYC